MQRALGFPNERLTAYAASHADLLRRDPAFAHWLRSKCKPLIGSWQY